MVTWTETQLRRLQELDASEPDIDQHFENAAAREKAFQEIEKNQALELRQRLKVFREVDLRPGLCRLEARLIDTLIKQGFVQVTTPIMMSRGLLQKMSIDASHPLNSQIYWLDKNKCLRPMLAPHLYYVLVDLLRLWDKPVKIFEVGPCFRKESQGAQHSSEFTMLNLVEMGLPADQRKDRIKELGALVSEAAGVNEYHFEKITSEIYGDTIDIVAGKDQVEVGSAAMGPHPLDRPWKITDTWVGIGFGLERLLMVAQNSSNLAKMGRSLTYLDGIRLNIQ
ncbi:MAG: pyrrolysine--tRNA(Pyl) ligase large subunit [Desulfobacterales bacterium]|jgi:phenylalanyl-tRNA synthetase alpha chain|nr:pyrrolysine--tRNA(Pyl) ligase large subunit [Desulfobacterales bacterium]MDH3886843.1 pyrrolysine--tRNA(Pyl) ligase large subunit [Desulfobacterales bacterium]